MQSSTILLHLTDLNSSQIEICQLGGEPTWQLCDLNHETHQFSAYEIILLIPSHYVRLLTFNLPKLSKHKYQQALRYAVEEHVLGNVEDLHIASYGQADQTVVAIIHHEVMKKILAWCTHYHLHATRIIPDMLALPHVAQTWTVLLHHNVALVRLGENSAFSIELENLGYCLHQKINEQGKPEVLNFFNVDANLNEDNFHDLGIRKINFYACQSPCLIFAKNSQSSPLNLLQAEYKVSKSVPVSRKNWKTVLIMVGVLLISIFGKVLIENHQLSKQKAKLDQQISQLYYQVFPQASSVVSPQFRIQQQLSQLGIQVSADPFEPLFIAVAQVLHSMPEINLQKMIYQNQQITISFETLNTSQSQDLIKKLKLANLRFKIVNSAKTTEITIWMK